MPRSPSRGLVFRPAFAVLVLSACALATGCGGGGDDAEPPVAAASSPSGGQPVTTAASTCGQPDFVATALARINERRAAGATCGSGGAVGPAGAVAWNERLAAAADGHSRDMVAGNFFSHAGSAGSTLAMRVDASGYAWGSLGENLAAGTPTVAATIDAWMASPGHCANLMAGGFSEIGLACVPGNANTTYRTYWTLTLARPR